MVYFNPLNFNTLLQIIKVIEELQKYKSFQELYDSEFSKTICNDHTFRFNVISCTSQLPTCLLVLSEGLLGVHKNFKILSHVQ
jgi:hypothetical protein